MSSEVQAGASVVAQDLVKRYESGRIVALDGMSFEVVSGEFVALVGPSGCGKSTLLNMIAAIDRPDAGEIRVDGRSLGRLQEREATTYRAATVGLVFQLHNLLPNLTAAENIQVAMMPTRAGPQERCRRAAELLQHIGLGHRADAPPPVLSGGERQRIAIARAMASRPRLLLADEPTGALDSHTGDQLFDLLAQVRRESGVTLIVVTHDPRVAERADRVLHMLDGRIVA